jgi:three-Cys-motif partner protein
MNPLPLSLEAVDSQHGTPTVRFDEIGYWSEVKLDIVKEYAATYSRILTAQRRPRLHHVYIDAFAGAGLHRSKTRGAFIPGSSVNALQVQPPFREYHFIDLQQEKVNFLRRLMGERSDVQIYRGDCNAMLLQQIFPRVRYEDYRRGLCLLDPYGLHLQWEVIATAGRLHSLELFLNFPVADINRNVLWRNPAGVDPVDIARMTAFWGDESWRDVAYTTEDNLFGFAEKVDNDTVAEAFRRRLRTVAGFAYVPKPVAMRNSNGATVYYLFFAAQTPVAAHIVEAIFAKYRDRGAR